MLPQPNDWTCSASALSWVLQATAIAPGMDVWAAVEAIGHPHNINSQLGLTDASGPALRRVYEGYGVRTYQAWLGFDAVYDLARHSTGQLSGANWYHWVAIRGVAGDALHVANSAPGYRGIWDHLTRADYARLGPFSVVWLSA